MKKSLVVILAALFLISIAACSDGRTQTANETTEPTDIIYRTAAPEETPVLALEPFVFDRETDVDNRFVKCVSNSFVEFPDYDIYQFGFGFGPVYYWDKTTGEVGVLCNKPDCDHTGGDCNGSTGNLSMLNYYAGRLYWLSYPYRETGKNCYSVYSMDVDSTDRREEYRFDLEKEGCFPGNMYVHRGKIFFTTLYRAIENGAPGYEKSVEVLTLGSNDRKSVCEIKSSSSAPIYAQFGGDNAYFLTSELNDEGFLAVYLTQYNIVTEASESREYVIERPEMWISGCYLTPDGKLYIAMFTDYEEYPGGVYRIDDDEITEVFAFEDGEHMYSVSFGDRVVCAITLLSPNPKSFLIWITDLDGNTVYKGELPMGYRSAISESSETNGRDLLVGSGSSLFVMANESLVSGGTAMVLVKYDFSSDGIDEEVIAVYEQHISN